MKPLLFLLFLLSISSVFSQNFEFVLKQYSILGEYGDQTSQVVLFTGNPETSKQNIETSTFVSGVKARYINKNNTSFGLEFVGLYGNSEFIFTQEGEITNQIKVKPQVSNILFLSLGKIINVKKLRLSPVFKFGLSHTKKGLVQELNAFNKDKISQITKKYDPKVSSVITGPSLGVSYEILSNIHFGLEFDYFLYYAFSYGSLLETRDYFNNSGAIINSTSSTVDFDKNTFTLGNLGVSWALFYSF